MDTREKILDLAGAAAVAAGLRSRGVKWKLVAGYFDVLTPGQVRELATLADGTPVMAAVVDPPHPLLAARARAELAASLRVVDYVIVLDGASLEQVVAELAPDEVARRESADLLRGVALIEHVHRRNNP